MPLIVPHEWVAKDQKVRVEGDGCTVALRHFIKGDVKKAGPQAMLVKEDPRRRLRTHY
jgi:hypothetical protein